MNLDNFLYTTDANNQKQYLDIDTVVTTSTSASVTHSEPHPINGIPDVKVWIQPTLMGKWKKLGNVSLVNSSPFSQESIVGEVSATTTDVTIELSSTFPAMDVPVKIRIYYND